MTDGQPQRNASAEEGKGQSGDVNDEVGNALGAGRIMWRDNRTQVLRPRTYEASLDNFAIAVEKIDTVHGNCRANGRAIYINRQIRRDVAYHVFTSTFLTLISFLSSQTYPSNRC